MTNDQDAPLGHFARSMSAEELDSLPDKSVVMDMEHTVYQRLSGDESSWYDGPQTWRSGDGWWYDSASLAERGGLVVVYQPDITKEAM